MKENPIQGTLLAQGNWGEDQALLQGLRQWQYAPVLWQAYETLQEEALFHSQVHGPRSHSPGSSPGGAALLEGGCAGGDGPASVPGGQLSRCGKDL